MADYTPTGVPVTDSDLVSSEIRAEFALIETAIATKLDSTGSTDITTLGTVTTGEWNATDIAVTAGGTGRSTSTTAYGLLAAGTTATGAHQTLAAGATTEILVGGGAAALPVWTAATGTGAPVRADSPALVTPDLGTPSALVGTNITGTAAGLTAGTVTTNANLTGHVTSTGNAAVLGSFTLAELNTAISDGDVPTAATQADQETATSTTTYVSPGRQHLNPSAAKFFVKFDAAGGIQGNAYNVASITDTGVGNLTVNIATDFSTDAWCASVACTMADTTGAVGWFAVRSQAAGTLSIIGRDIADSGAQDFSFYYASGFGDQA